MHSAVIQHKQETSSGGLVFLNVKPSTSTAGLGSRLRGYYSCYAIAPFAHDAALISPLHRIHPHATEEQGESINQRAKGRERTGLRRHCILPPKGPSSSISQQQNDSSKTPPVGPSAGDSLVSWWSPLSPLTQYTPAGKHVLVDLLLLSIP